MTTISTQRLTDAVEAWRIARQQDDWLRMYVAGQEMAKALEEALAEQEDHFRKLIPETLLASWDQLYNLSKEGGRK